MTDREPVAQAVNSIIAMTVDIGRMVIRPETYDEVLAEYGALMTLKSNVEFIVSIIRENENAKEKERQRLARAQAAE